MSSGKPEMMRANGNISIGRFVAMDPADNNSVIQAVLNSRTIGVADMAGREAPVPSVTTDPPYAAISGDNVRVHTLGDQALLRLGTGGSTSGRTLKSDANGCGIMVALTAKGRIGAVALETALINEYCKVQVVMFDQVDNAS